MHHRVVCNNSIIEEQAVPMRQQPPDRSRMLCICHTRHHRRAACLKVRSPILTKSRRFHVCSEHGTRCGHDIVYRMGSRMSGQPSCITNFNTLSAVRTSHTARTLTRNCMQATAGSMSH